MPSRHHLARLVLLITPLAWFGCGGGGTDVVVPSLNIATSTTGVELDPDGYVLLIDGEPGQSIGLAGTITIDRLSDGEHTVELSGLAPNCAAADNPRIVTVSAGATINVAFAVSCSPTAGTIEVTTATSGPEPDPDGYALLLDGAEHSALGINASITVNGLTPGTHAVGLSGLASTCQVVGENPRTVTVSPGHTTQVPFAITCAPPQPGTGSLQITTATSGAASDPDGYTVSVDETTSQPIGANATLLLTGLAVGNHTVRLDGIASSCRLTEENPRSVTISDGATATVSFSISCSANTGSLRVTIEGLPPGTAGAVTVSGAGGFVEAVTATRTVTGLAAGSYSVSAADVTAGSSTYTASVDRPTVEVTAGNTANVAVRYSPPAGATLNLRIDGLYLTQSTQKRSGEVALVANRDALLRVFVEANESNNARPAVRVRLSRGGTTVRTITIPPPGTSTPVRSEEASLQSSWNAEIDGSLITPGLSIAAEVDPNGSFRESNEGDNAFPASGTALPLTVRTVPPARIRFVPIVQSANGLRGEVGNTGRLMDLARRMYPLASVETDVRSPYTATGPLQPDDENGQWNQILTDIEALRTAEGSNRTYYGVVRLSYGSGIVGNGFVGAPSAMGTDDPGEIVGVLAHELGHTWGRYHSPCGNPGGLDPFEVYPYPAGGIGVYGYDLTARRIRNPGTPDIMGYCPDPWISDHTYRRVMIFRQSLPLEAMGGVQPCLLLWGRIEGGRPVLEPAFRIVTRPRLPDAPGPYLIEADAVDGSRLFSLSFDAIPIANSPESRRFAFAVPLDPAHGARLSSLRSRGPGGSTSPLPSLMQLEQQAATDTVAARREGERVLLNWNAARYPMLMVRDPSTGEVLSFARGGQARIWTGKNDLDVALSDRVQSRTVRAKATTR